MHVTAVVFTGAHQIGWYRESTGLGAADMLGQEIPVPDHAPPDAFGLSDDECVQRLAQLIKHRDSKTLDEIVGLIARLAVPIEG